MQQSRKTVAVALSGGVDSAVAASLLLKSGYAVLGVFAKTWTPTAEDGTTCTWVADRRDALRVAAFLHIPLVTVNLEPIYRQQVVRPLFAGYAQGETPNPDVLCNQAVKFGALFRAARRLGADCFATGHYARIVACDNSGSQKSPRSVMTSRGREISGQKKNEKDFLLLRGVDATKDQSYFLWDIPRRVLPQIQFPIGHLAKVQVRALARELGLPVAAKKDSQGICFLGQTDLRTFLSHQLPAHSGTVLDAQTDAVIGTHPGAQFFTIGQRHGFGTPTVRTTQNTEPRYVTHVDTERNLLWVGPRRLLFKRVVLARTPHWLDGQAAALFSKTGSMRVMTQVRYHQEPVAATITRLKGRGYRVNFDAPVFAPTPGQSLVMYQAEQLVGGMIIAKVGKISG